MKTTKAWNEFEEILFPKGVRIFSTFTFIVKDEYGEVAESHDCITEEGQHFGPFLGYEQKEEVIEFETFDNKFVQLNTRTKSWHTVSKRKSLILKREKLENKIMVMNDQIMYHYYNKNFELDIS